MKAQKHSDRMGKTNEQLIDSFDYLSNAASLQDCTGLIPSAPLTGAELESYEELYHFLPPESSTKNIQTEESQKDE